VRNGERGTGNARPVPLLEGRGLRVVRGNTNLLDIPSLAVHDGEILALIGPNGAGKSTLLQTLCYLMMPFQGEIFFQGQRVGGGEYPVSEYRRRATMVFQEPLLFDATVFGNVAAGLRFRGTGRSEVERIVEENLERFGISHLRNRRSRALSGGEAQRTSLARAFATRPEVLFLDEPFAALDAPTRESLLGDLERVLREFRTTTVLATHDRNEALRLSDRIAVMDGGRIAQSGPPEAVMNHPVDEFVASFVGMETILPGIVTTVCDGTFLVAVSGKEIEAAGSAREGDRALVCIRPENVTLAREVNRAGTSARNVFRSTVREIVSMGFYQRVNLDCGFPLVAYVTQNSLDTLMLHEGASVDASFKATAIHVVLKKAHPWISR
jgi:tungstate transport system ATP-binding protein